ncbi:phage tail tube protein [Achromobacter xylosoxidans]|uniref:Major tail protein n=1 Tax=Achromobacter phage JWX TaxID=1589746 RepID=A0A0B5A1M0_9CAUD|nr:phage tail tube protein [Achromobacter xylosoxidans]YP_009196202.1 hypothetical protein AVV28_gp17 [Achromobacter phage JWX]AJD82783.1 hypothetical protein JWX_00017 [Achromobacter phage JWX]WLW38438.1 minor tail protein [Achromobacter phage JWT]
MATCAVHKIDSNIVGTRIAVEECLKELPQPAVNTVWNPLEPNGFQDFGVQTTTSARNPLNPSRQRQKGIVVDREASVGFGLDFVLAEQMRLLPGMMFSTIRTPAGGSQKSLTDATVSIENGMMKLSVVGLGTALDSLRPGDWLFIGGDAGKRLAEDGNNGFKRLFKIDTTANELWFDKGIEKVEAETFVGDFDIYVPQTLRNELGSDIVRTSYQFERTLGSLDGNDPPQAEYVSGAVPSTYALNIPTAEKMTTDWTYMACDGQLRTQAEGLKPGTRPTLPDQDAYNTSTDLKRIVMSRVHNGTTAPAPLFGFLLESTLNINNNLSGNKALGVVGNFDISAGTFEVSISATAYFSDVEAIRAVHENADVTLDYVFMKNRQGMVIDLPLLSLGDGRPNVELDQPITLPLTGDAATAKKLGADFDYTLNFNFFTDLPALADELYQ